MSQVLSWGPLNTSLSTSLSFFLSVCLPVFPSAGNHSLSHPSAWGGDGAPLLLVLGATIPYSCPTPRLPLCKEIPHSLKIIQIEHTICYLVRTLPGLVIKNRSVPSTGVLRTLWDWVLSCFRSAGWLRGWVGKGHRWSMACSRIMLRMENRCNTWPWGIKCPRQSVILAGKGIIKVKPLLTSWWFWYPRHREIGNCWTSNWKHPGNIGNLPRQVWGGRPPLQSQGRYSWAPSSMLDKTRIVGTGWILRSGMGTFK